MSLREEAKDFIYRSVFTSLIAIIIFVEIYKVYDPELIIRSNIIYLLLISASFNVLLVLYHKIHWYIFPGILLVGAAFYFLNDAEAMSSFFESTAFALILIGFGSFVFFLISDISVIIGLIVSLGILGYMLYFLFAGLEIHPATPPLACFYIFSIAVRFSRDGFKKAESKRMRSYQAFLLPFLLLMMLILFLLPKPEKPISWEWAKNLYNNTVDWINTVIHDISMSLSSGDDKDAFSIRFDYGKAMTYSNDSNEVIEVIEVTPHDRIFGNIYIRGMSFNKFENGNWYNTLETEDDYSSIDAFETYYGLVNFNKDKLNDITRKASLKIRFLNFTSDLFFSPAKLLTPDKTEMKKNIMYENEQILFNKKKTYGNEYELDFMQLNYGGNAFTEFLNAGLEDNEEALELVKDIYLRALYPDMTLEKLKKYREYVKKYYSGDVRANKEVGQWINDVTKEAENDYDKLKLLEKELSKMNYSYLEGELPEYVKSEGDFLIYFILEKQSGYCVHYATAFCLLARYMGLPSRIVQGYKASVKVNEPFIIENTNGHSWPEVYFEGKGWIAFEPTPGFGSERYSGWKESSPKNANSSDSDFYYEENRATPTPPPGSVTENQTVEESISIFIIIGIIAIVLVSLLMLIIFGLLINRRKRKKLDKTGLYHLAFFEIEEILKEIGIVREKTETLEEFAAKYNKSIRKIMDDCGIENRSFYCTDISFLKTREDVIYGGLIPGNEELGVLWDAKKKFLRLLKKYYRMTYAFHKLHLFFVTSIKNN